jgi:hypothetical protein
MSSGSEVCQRTEPDPTKPTPAWSHQPPYDGLSVGPDVFGAAQLELTKIAPQFDQSRHLLDATEGMDRYGVALVTQG